MNALLLLATEYLRYNLHGLLGVASALFTLGVGAVVLFQQPRSRIHQTFFVHTVAAAVWTGCFGMMSVVRSATDAGLWLSLSYVAGVPLIMPSYYFFAASFTGYRLPRSIVAAAITLSAMSMVPMVFFHSHICWMRDYSWGRYPNFIPTFWGNVYYLVLTAHFWLFGLLTLHRMFTAWRTADSPTEKVQFRNVLIGLFIAFSGACDFLTTFNFPVYPFGFISLAIYIGLIAYTIVRHHLLQINVLARRFTVIFLIYSFLFAFLMPALLFLAKRLSEVHRPDLLAPVLLFSIALGMTLSLGPALYSFLLRNSFWLKGHMSSGIVHELKSPLSAIRGALALLEDQLPEGETGAKVREYAEMAIRNSDRLELFVNDLLAVAQIQDGVIRIEPTRFDLADLIRENAESFRIIAERKGLALHVEAVAAHINGDRIKLGQGISNLLSNAIKFSKSGTVSIRASKLDRQVRLTVSDQGDGIPSSQLGRVFERFVSLNKSSKGSGLGLTIAKAWIEAHGGKIWAESEGEGKGTTVTFTIPAREAR